MPCSQEKKMVGKLANMFVSTLWQRICQANFLFFYFEWLQQDGDI